MSRPLAAPPPATAVATEHSSPSPDGRPPTDGRPRSRRRIRLAAIGAIVLVLAAGGAVMVLQSGASGHAPASTGIRPGDTTTTVERRTLVERSSVDGTLSYGGAVELYDRLAGTFTWLPAIGAVIARGGTLFRLDNLPVVLMYGSVPAYRALKEGVGDGPDVGELNTNLIDLGLDPYRAIADDEHFGEATGAAVRRWQKAEGLPQTGEVELGRVLFVAGARRITVVHVSVGEDPPPAGAKEPARKPGANKPAGRQPSAKEKAAKEGARERAAKERGEKEQAAKEHAAKDSSKESSEKPKEKEKSAKEAGGSGGAAPVLALGTTSTRQIVQLQVKADQQELAHVGESAPVTLPNGDVVQGHITNVGTVAAEASENEKEKGGGAGNPSSGSGENATTSVTLALDHRVARLDKAPVSVQLVKSIRHNVLAVPATALVATAGGGYAVRAVEGARSRELAVTPGMFANGYVEIEGVSIHAGLTVTEPR